MAFEYKCDIPTGDGGTEKIVLTFKEITLVPIRVLRHNRHDTESQMWDTLEWGLSDDQLELLDRLPSRELQKIIEAWQNSDDGVEVGESDASSTSSNDTGRPSKLTSSKTDSD